MSVDCDVNEVLDSVMAELIHIQAKMPDTMYSGYSTLPGRPPGRRECRR